MYYICLAVMLFSLVGCYVSEPPPEPRTSSGRVPATDNQTIESPEKNIPDAEQGRADQRRINAPVLPTDPNRIIKPQGNGPTFTRDVLPLLSSTATGRIYKCTVCHRAYTDYDVVSQPATLQRILSRIGPGGNMPLNEDPVKSADIEMLREWQKQGYQR
jgi:hypothetical protein